MRKFLLSIILICALIVPALAHPGGTDSSGGHYDHSTGEYHYHHGYPPHDHEDLDGDGDLDCPHNFVDKAGQDSGESSGSVTRYPPPTSPPAPPAPTVAEPEQDSWLKTVWDVVMVIGILGVGFFAAAFAGIALSAPVTAIQLAFAHLSGLLRKGWAASKRWFLSLPGWYRATIFALAFVIVYGLFGLAVRRLSVY